jgi:hypothetical protein
VAEGRTLPLRNLHTTRTIDRLNSEETSRGSVKGRICSFFSSLLRSDHDISLRGHGESTFAAVRYRT